MVRISVENESEGSVPSEVLVQITTVDGLEDVVVHRDQVQDGSMEAGLIGGKDDKVLVELPRESVSGRWRVWVSKNKLVAA